MDGIGMGLNTLRNLQLAELGILKKFIKICEENHLRYYLCGGTLLGAARHKGFIPWDDDIDLAMPREDYIKFFEIYKDKHHEEDEKFFIDLTVTQYPSMIQIVNKSVKVIDKNAITVRHRYAWLDIFPIDGLPESNILRFFHARRFLFGRMLYKFAGFESGVDLKRANRPFYEKILINIYNKLKIYKYFNDEKKYLCSADKILLKYSMYKTGGCCIFWGISKIKEIYQTDWFGEGVPIEFEDITANAPQNYDRYLSRLYGDYMILPPEDKRQRHDIEIIISEEIK
ncbi:MAG: LicD family protein [Chitinispirillales bacterium]|nr:LicD family protein [Chitinispirillales bacterium]